LIDNDVKTLNDCQAWKDSMPVLGSAVMGIRTLSGTGCTNCNFSHERQREVTTHMRKVHGCENDILPIHCTLQRIFSSKLHGFWRVDTTVPTDGINDEGILALSLFNAEVRKLEQEDSRSAIGIPY
jgi:hypothetical protein